jgi:hypothetical protein
VRTSFRRIRPATGRAGPGPAEAQPFDPARHQRFQQTMAVCGDPETLAIKRRVTDAVVSGEPPSAMANDRHGRAGIRIALRQMKPRDGHRRCSPPGRQASTRTSGRRRRRGHPSPQWLIPPDHAAISAEKSARAPRFMVIPASDRAAISSRFQRYKMNDEPKSPAEMKELRLHRKRSQEVEGIKAMAEIAAADIAIRKRTETLRALRLAKEAADIANPPEPRVKTKAKTAAKTAAKTPAKTSVKTPAKTSKGD